MNTVVYFEIQSSDPSREIAFYAEVFGWKFSKEEKLPTEYYRIETSGINGGLIKRITSMAAPTGGTNAFTCSLEVEAFDNSAEIIVKNGGKVALPKFAVPGKCWQGYFLDTDQNVFGIFQVDKNAR